MLVSPYLLTLPTNDYGEVLVEWIISEKPVEYAHALETMERRVAGILDGSASEAVWLLEHPPVYTAGTSAAPSDILDNRRFPIFQVGRGGSYTYHGPGQLVAYVMIDLSKSKIGKDLRKYVYMLEEWIIQTLARFNIKSERRAGRTGIWVVTGGREAKIAAIGVRVRRWVTFHGISINISPNLEHFQGIVPCGIKEYGVTSMRELGIQTDMQAVGMVLKELGKDLLSRLIP